jgi:hypothetical protein
MNSFRKPLVILVGAVLVAALSAAPVAAGLIAEDFVPSGGKWGSPVFGTGAAVTWSLMGPGVSCAGECTDGTFTPLDAFMPAGYLAEITRAFDSWAAVADITFTQVADNGLPFNALGATGDIRIGGHTFDGGGGTLAHGYFPPPNGISAAGDIHFDIGDPWQIGFGGPGFDFFTVMAHEIGHAIGLRHTAVPGSLMNPFYTEGYDGPQADDIEGAVFIYGEPEGEPVPEPGTILLIGSGLIAFVLRRRRG